MRPRHGALNVCFEGAEDLPGGKYGTSLSLDVAMDPTRDVMIAYMQNGQILTPDHGFPIRMIIPGFIGGRMVKWLKRIVVTTKESESYYHYRDNRVLPSHVDAELADSEGWWYKPEYVINELNINSVITSPEHDEILQINSLGGEETCVLRGYAYSGGGRKVTRVEITLDGGETWRICALNHPEKPNKYGKYWCWCFWSLQLHLVQFLPANYIAVRAWDQSLNTQPEKPTWNLMGMMNNSWFRIKVSSSPQPNGAITLSFQHPTQPGTNPGGWMTRNETPKPNKNPIFPTKDAIFSLSDLRTHNSPNSAWIAVHGQVYDCTSFLKHHPGGPDSILINAGADCTEQFDAIHSHKAKSLLQTYHIGKLREKISITLVAKTKISRTVRLFRFTLPSPVQIPCFPTGKHIYLSATIDHKPCIRAYTPTSPDSAAAAAGYLEIMVRIYLKGMMTQHLDALPLGAAVEMEGPAGRIEYAGKGGFLFDGKERFARRVAMVAGGTGIAPVYQVIRAVMREEEGVEEVDLVYACRSEEEILLKGELDGWAGEKGGRLRVWYVVGKLTEGVLKERIPVGGDEGSLALVCGPPGMVRDLVLPVLEKMGYFEEKGSCLVF